MYSQRADTASLSPVGDVSFEGWIKLRALPSTGSVAMYFPSKYDGDANRSWYWRIDASDKMGFKFWDSGGEGDPDASGFTSDSAVIVSGELNTWIHWAVTVDVSGPSVIFYKNLVVQADTADLTNATDIKDGNQEFTIGALDHSSASGFVEGLMNNVRMYGDIRTPTELADNWKTVLASDDNLIGSWFSDKADANDLTSNNNDLTDEASPTYSQDVPFGGSIMNMKKYW